MIKQNYSSKQQAKNQKSQTMEKIENKRRIKIIALFIDFHFFSNFEIRE